MMQWFTVIVLVMSIAVNIFAAVRLNRAYDKLADMFCIESLNP